MKKKSKPLVPFTLTPRIIIDSGAFTAWTKGVKIDVDEYADFCLEHLDVLDRVVNLDCIPGKFGVPTAIMGMDEIRRAAREGYENYLHMLKRGIPEEKLIHVFHQGEEFHWLDKIANNTYIALSPANDRNTRDRIDWLDECMKHIKDEDGNFTTKFHGLAVTSLRLMLRYPWTSVDSASWKRNAAYGKVYVPRKFNNGDADWGSQGMMVITSIKQTHKQEHFENLPQLVKEKIKKIIEDVGVATLDGMVHGKVWPRATWNCHYFLKLQQACDTRIFFAAVDKLSVPSIIKAHEAAGIGTVNALYSYEYVKDDCGSSQIPAWKNMVEKKRKEISANENKERKFARSIG